MPSKFHPMTHIAEDAVLGWRETQKGAYWYLRFYCREGKHKGNHFKACGVPFEDGFSSQKRAEKIATKHYRDFLSNAKAGNKPSLKLTPEYLRKSYVADIQDRCAKNEALQAKGKRPIWEVVGGRGYWTPRKTKEAVRVLDAQIKEFIESELPSELSKVKQRELNRFRDWARDRYGWAPGTINKGIVQLRMIWRFGYERDWVAFVPEIKQQPADLVLRTRRKLQPEEYRELRDKARLRYESLLDKGISSGYHFDQRYQFYFWLLLMSNSGIRPPAGQEERLLLRWEDIKYVNKGKPTERRFLLRKSEKAHLNYEAVILPNAHLYLDELKRLQKDRGVKSTYIFAHTTTRPGFWEKGDPIQSFKKQWNNLLKDCGLDSPVGTPQSEKIVPYSLRAFFLTSRLENSDTLRIEDLAKATGTSAEMIEMLYYDYSTRKRYKPLTEGRQKRESLEPVYKDGRYVGRG